MIGWKELAIVLVIVLLVFGTRKLATLGKDLGQAVAGFRKGVAEGGGTATDAAAIARDEGSDAGTRR